MSIKSELLGGFVQFVSCCYVLPVVPTQLSMAGYPSSAAVVVTAACCGIGSILGSGSLYIASVIRVKVILIHQSIFE